MEQVVKSPAAVQTTAVGAKQNVFPFEEVFPRPLAELILALNPIWDFLSISALRQY